MNFGLFFYGFDYLLYIKHIIMEELIRKIRELKFEKGYTNKEISKELNITIDKAKRVTCKRYNDILQRKKIREDAEKEFVEMVKKYLPVSNSLNNLCYNLGLKGVDGYYKKLKRIIEENNLSTEHFGTIRIKKEGRYRNRFTAMPDEEFFNNGCNRSGDSILKRLVEGGYKEYKCEGCKTTEWMGKPLRLQVHHINGDHYDNRIENIQILCPNCHSQTDTYARNNVINGGGFKVTKRAEEILNGEENSFVAKDIDEIKKSISLIPTKEKKYCIRCGKEINGDGEKYCSHECSEAASRKFEVTAPQLIEDFKDLRSYRAVGRKYNVSDNAIKKRCIKFGIIGEIEKYIVKR